MGFLTHAEMSMLSVNGRISVSLNRSEKELKIRLSVPSGARALLPVGEEVQQVKLEGKKIFKNKKFYPDKRYKADFSDSQAVRISGGEWEIELSYR